MTTTRQPRRPRSNESEADGEKDDVVVEAVLIAPTPDESVEVQETAMAVADGRGGVSPVRSAFRMAVGGVSFGMAQAARVLANLEDEIGEQDVLEVAGDAAPSPASRLRHAVIGAAIEAPPRAAVAFDRALDDLEYATDRFVAPVITPVWQSKLVSPLRARIESLTEAVTVELGRLADVGAIEERRGERLAVAAFDGTVDYFISQAAESPELQEIVREQSAGLTRDVMNEVRERGVSADVLAETVVHRLFKWRRPNVPPAPPGASSKATDPT